MAKAAGPRKARFLAALRLAGLTMDQWARKHGSTQGYVSNLLVGRRENPKLLAKADAFAERYLPTGGTDIRAAS